MNINKKYGVVIFNIENKLKATKDHEILNLKQGDNALKIRRNLYIALDRAHALRIGNSMCFIYCIEQSRSMIFDICNEIKELGGTSCYFNTDDQTECINKCIYDQLVESINKAQTSFQKAKKQKIKNKAKSEIEFQLEKLSYYFELLEWKERSELDSYICEYKNLFKDLVIPPKIANDEDKE